ncbi:Cu-Zn family superoxide dismutase [Devosia subaequoris]|uniref:Superoxide dismutase [Cu-Zn] n=1 Tax=Devosia subaequoris TaxID=395930 RepID=A0A7W6NBC0_9HYPH|nr:superoxide dismutase family protein [Devosia subaequoris]MBB4051539.1 Cu-Zn family superoxide dismutase [Devosia subaequoris]MCP1209132.1 superoxide dismutase family protein [Devosia subaequoris]
MRTKIHAASLVALMIAAPAMAQDAPQSGADALGGPSALAVFVAADGSEVGTVTLTPNDDGSVTLSGGIQGMAPGDHGFHFHQTGECDPSTNFESAGSHFNPTDAQHGLDNPEGPHLGDMPNVTAGEDGVVRVELTSDLVTLEEGQEGSLFDDDGTAIIIHSGPDDQTTDPSGDSGDRIACAVVEPGAAVE